jgi:[FeFe] hydrogenase H-cluster maturation GTPase HydF
MGLTDTPASNRLHIAIFGKRNSGKSSLINAITGQSAALISDIAGTTTDPVYKAMEVHGIGPCMIIDTAGFDDEGELGRLRVEKTKAVIDKTDIAIIVFSDGDIEAECEWAEILKKRNIPVAAVLNKIDVLKDYYNISGKISSELDVSTIPVSAKSGAGISELINLLISLTPENYEKDSLTASLAREGDSVLLVMPQDIQAPKGRLILPQVQTIRDLLDKKCVVTCVTTGKLEEALKNLKKPPELIITDSQVFSDVYAKKPKESRLTSFSILMAASKGDIHVFADGAETIDALTEESRVLIAEACTHAPLEEDIGRVKIPRILRKRVGEKLHIDMVSGMDFPEDLSCYDLIIHCGGCMFNRRYVLSRIRRAQEQGVPITNYGVALAKLGGILDKVELS